MTITVNEAQTGFGITTDVGTFRWNGHGFNPTGDKTDGYQSFDPYNDSYAGVTAYNPTTSFDLTGYQYGNEVVLFLVKYTTDVAQTVTTIITFKDPDGNALYVGLFTPSMPANSYYANWLGIGIKEYPSNEIWKDGTYTVEYVISHSSGTESGSVSFTISNYPATTSGTASDVGALWVEGDNLAYICAQRRKIVVKHDGTSSYKGTAYKGAIWLETDGKISYIDSSGYKRSTKAGDQYGYDNTGELPSTPGTTSKGSIWACNDYYDAYLMIVSSDGTKYRIGPGYVGSGDYQ